MKQFNKVISVEVSVDTIANLLLANMNPEFKHKENVVESIIGRMMQDNSLGYLYNSLNGYSSSIDFKVGDEVCSSGNDLRVYGYWTPDSIERDDTVYGNVTSARVKEINEYSDKKLLIEYQVPNKKGGYDTSCQWVKHTEWNKSVLEAVVL